MYRTGVAFFGFKNAKTIQHLTSDRFYILVHAELPVKGSSNYSKTD